MTNKQLAKAIIRELMTVYCGTRRDNGDVGTRLAIMKGKAGVAEISLGGLCKEAAEERVLEILNYQIPVKTTRVNFAGRPGKEKR